MQSLMSKEPWTKRCLTESLISDLWQSWCHFCREVILLSCQGTVTRNGLIVSARDGVNCWQRLGYEAKCAANNNVVKPTKQLTHQRHEPTWGDQEKMIDIIKAVAPANTAHLITAFGLPLYGPRHLQIVRNACFHKNSEAIVEVRKLISEYYVDSLKSPSDLAWFIDKQRKCCAIYSWCEDLTVIVELATKS